MVAGSYLYNPNKTFTGISVSQWDLNKYLIWDINFDSKGRLVIVDGYVKVYY